MKAMPPPHRRPLAHRHHVEVHPNGSQFREPLWNRAHVLLPELAPFRQIVKIWHGETSGDSIACRYWDRWGMLNCSITAAGFGPAGALACTRVGVLPTMQNGWHELSCDRRGVALWLGGEYRVP
jgi:hypothetical protein